MLQTYHAEITGTHLEWLGPAPKHPLRQRAVVVFDAPVQQAAPKPAAVSGYRAARGSLGKASRESILAELSAMRDEWQR
jgi:hypothetical protein